MADPEITIGRTSNPERIVFEISIPNQDQVILIHATMSLRDFANAITGAACQPFQIESYYQTADLKPPDPADAVVAPTKKEWTKKKKEEKREKRKPGSIIDLAEYLINGDEK